MSNQSTPSAMTELERLLVACVGWEDDHPVASHDAMGVVLDWLEEQDSPRLADARGCVLAPLWDDGNQLAFRNVWPGAQRVIDWEFANPLRLGVNRYLSDADPDSEDEEWTLTLEERESAGRHRCIYTNRFYRKADPAATVVHALPVLGYRVPLARWHALCDVLGYSPLKLLACCAREAVT